MSTAAVGDIIPKSPDKMQAAVRYSELEKKCSQFEEANIRISNIDLTHCDGTEEIVYNFQVDTTPPPEESRSPSQFSPSRRTSSLPPRPPQQPPLVRCHTGSLNLSEVPLPGPDHQVPLPGSMSSNEIPALGAMALVDHSVMQYFESVEDILDGEDDDGELALDLESGCLSIEVSTRGGVPGWIAGVPLSSHGAPNDAALIERMDDSMRGGGLRFPGWASGERSSRGGPMVKSPKGPMAGLEGSFRGAGMAGMGSQRGPMYGGGGLPTSSSSHTLSGFGDTSSSSFRLCSPSLHSDPSQLPSRMQFPLIPQCRTGDPFVIGEGIAASSHLPHQPGTVAVSPTGTGSGLTSPIMINQGGDKWSPRAATGTSRSGSESTQGTPKGRPQGEQWGGVAPGGVPGAGDQSCASTPDSVLDSAEVEYGAASPPWRRPTAQLGTLIGNCDELVPSPMKPPPPKKKGVLSKLGLRKGPA